MITSLVRLELEHCRIVSGLFILFLFFIVDAFSLSVEISTSRVVSLLLFVENENGGNKVRPTQDKIIKFQIGFILIICVLSLEIAQ